MFENVTADGKNLNNNERQASFKKYLKYRHLSAYVLRAKTRWLRKSGIIIHTIKRVVVTVNEQRKFGIPEMKMKFTQAVNHLIYDHRQNYCFWVRFDRDNANAIYDNNNDQWYSAD